MVTSGWGDQTTGKGQQLQGESERQMVEVVRCPINKLVFVLVVTHSLSSARPSLERVTMINPQLQRQKFTQIYFLFNLILTKAEIVLTAQLYKCCKVIVAKTALSNKKTEQRPKLLILVPVICSKRDFCSSFWARKMTSRLLIQALSKRQSHLSKMQCNRVPVCHPSQSQTTIIIE